MFEKFKAMFEAKDKKGRNIALLVDGPNVIRREMNIDLDFVKKAVQKHGTLKVSKIYLDQYASDKLIEAMVNQGFQPVITTGDVDVTMAVEAMEQVFNPAIHTIALMTRDIDFRPVLVKAKELGKETIIIGAEPGFSVALKNTADVVIIAQTK
ncbi:TIGR00288 family NYN domain-containing protein [Candidatus Parvarchaeota archaeon]|nr:TIGR00288 family NYN domain-containing protein [Candidatus Parvarchaeota archaeon]